MDIDKQTIEAIRYLSQYFTADEIRASLTPGKPATETAKGRMLIAAAACFDPGNSPDVMHGFRELGYVQRAAEMVGRARVVGRNTVDSSEEIGDYSRWRAIGDEPADAAKTAGVVADNTVATALANRASIRAVCNLGGEVAEAGAQHSALLKKMLASTAGAIEYIPAPLRHLTKVTRIPGNVIGNSPGAFFLYEAGREQALGLVQQGKFTEAIDALEIYHQAVAVHLLSGAGELWIEARRQSGAPVDSETSKWVRNELPKYYDEGTRLLYDKTVTGLFKDGENYTKEELVYALILDHYRDNKRYLYPDVDVSKLTAEQRKKLEEEIGARIEKAIVEIELDPWKRSVPSNVRVPDNVMASWHDEMSKDWRFSLASNVDKSLFEYLDAAKPAIDKAKQERAEEPSLHFSGTMAIAFPDDGLSAPPRPKPAVKPPEPPVDPTNLGILNTPPVPISGFGDLFKGL